MKKTNTFREAAGNWLPELDANLTDTPVFEMEKGGLRLRLSPCKMPENFGKLIALVTVIDGDKTELFDFMPQYADEVLNLAAMCDLLIKK